MQEEYTHIKKEVEQKKPLKTDDCNTNNYAILAQKPKLGQRLQNRWKPKG
jgi:hypothetical protein